MGTRKALLALLLAALLGVATGACAADEPRRDESGEINETDEVDPNALKAGDCFDDPDDENATEVTSLTAVPCDEPHDNEVFHVFDLPDGEFPGSDEVKEQGLQGCEPELEDYVGATGEEAGLLIVPVTPTEGTWNDADDRKVICALYKADASKVTGSLKDSGPAEEPVDTETPAEQPAG